MIHSLKRSFLIIISCVFFAPLAYAQTNQSKPAKLRFLFLDESPGAYSIKLGTTYRQISSTPYAISQPFQPSNLIPLEVYKTSATPDPVTGVKPRIKVASIIPPINTPTALVVLSPQSENTDSKSSPTYQIQFFDNDPKSFPARSLRVLNLGHSQMAVQFGAEQAVIEPGASKILQPKTDKYNRAAGKIAVATPTEWKLLYNKILIFPPEARLTGVFVYSPSGLRHTYTALELAERGPPPPGHFWLTYSDTP